jgi:hypothetical protein
MTHKNQHEWVWMDEFGGYFYYCELCHRCKRDTRPSDKKYYTHKQAIIFMLEELKSHPSDCDCTACTPEGRRNREYYKKYYGI